MFSLPFDNSQLAPPVRLAYCTEVRISLVLLNEAHLLITTIYNSRYPIILHPPETWVAKFNERKMKLAVGTREHTGPYETIKNFVTDRIHME